MDEVTELRSRVRRLEARNRWLNALACVALLVVGTSLVIGQASAQNSASRVPDEIRAKRFVVVDDEGNCRATLGLSPGAFADGGPVPECDSAVLSLRSRNCKAGITLEVMHYGLPRLMFEGEDGKTRLAAGLLPDGSPCLWFVDKDHKDRLRILLDAEGKPRFLSKDKEGKETALAP